jgi:hypothetical protein
MRDRVLLAEIALLRALDLLTTYVNLSTGLYVEANPLQRALMQHPPIFLAAQALGAAALYLNGLLVEWVLRGYRRLSKLLVRLCYACLLSLPVLNNLGIVNVADALYSWL